MPVHVLARCSSQRIGAVIPPHLAPALVDLRCSTPVAVLATLAMVRTRSSSVGSGNRTCSWRGRSVLILVFFGLARAKQLDNWTTIIVFLLHDGRCPSPTSQGHATNITSVEELESGIALPVGPCQEGASAVANLTARTVGLGLGTLSSNVQCEKHV
jgi:hypothetical protein